MVFFNHYNKTPELNIHRTDALEVRHVLKRMKRKHL